MDLASRNYQEKRNFIRMRVDSPIEISTEEESLSGTCINLSGGGMLVSLDKTLSPGSIVKVAICSNHGHNPMLQAITQVNRVVAEDARFMLGLEIKDLIKS